MPEYYLGNNLIFTKKQIAAVFALEPLDLIILPEEEQAIFEQDLRSTLHALQEGNLQIIMRTRKALPDDFRKHFDSLKKQPQNQHSLMVKEYIAQLSEILGENIIPVKEYYLVFAIGSRTANQARVLQAINSLGNQIDRVGSSLKRAGINIKQVEGAQLAKLMRSFTRL